MQHQPSKLSKAKTVLTTIAHELQTDWHFSIAILTVMIGVLCEVGCSTYSTFFVIDVYEEQKLSKDAAQDHLSLLFLITYLLCLIPCLVIGYISDKTHIYILLLLTDLGILLFGAFILYSIHTN